MHIISTTRAQTALSSELATPVPQPDGQVLGSSIKLPTGFAPDLLVYANSILTIVIVIALGLVLFASLVAGFNWITAGGDKGKTDEARARMVNAIIGILIVSASFALLRFVSYFLGFESLEQVISSIVPIG